MITVTDPAAKQITEILSKHKPYAIGIRIGVKTTGCSGLAYVLDVYCSNIAHVNLITDMVHVETNGVHLFMDHKSEPYLQGTEIDFVVKDKFTKGFQFNNPNERDRCGCGESFRI